MTSSITAPRPRLREGDRAGLSEIPPGSRGCGVLRAGDQRDRAADRQDLCQSEEGGGHPGQGLEGRFKSSRRRTLPHPRRRLGAICSGRARCGDLLRQDRARCAACAADAVAHLHPAWHAAGIEVVVQDAELVGAARMAFQP